MKPTAATYLAKIEETKKEARQMLVAANEKLAKLSEERAKAAPEFQRAFDAAIRAQKHLAAMFQNLAE